LTLFTLIAGFLRGNNDGRPFVFLFFRLFLFLIATFFQLRRDTSRFFSGTAGCFLFRFLAGFGFLFALGFVCLTLLAFGFFALGFFFRSFCLGRLFGGRCLRNGDTLGLLFRRLFTCGLALGFRAGLGFFLFLAGRFFLGLTLGGFFRLTLLFFRQTRSLFGRLALGEVLEGEDDAEGGPGLVAAPDKLRRPRACRCA
jgi:hypothetical protein